MRVVIAGRTYDVPEGCEVTLSLRFPNGAGLSIHPTGEEPRARTVAEAARTRVPRAIVPGEMGRGPKKPGTGRKECPKCHEVCGASLKDCPNQFCDYVFVRSNG